MFVFSCYIYPVLSIAQATHVPSITMSIMTPVTSSRLGFCYHELFSPGNALNRFRPSSLCRQLHFSRGISQREKSTPALLSDQGRAEGSSTSIPSPRISSCIPWEIGRLEMFILFHLFTRPRNRSFWKLVYIKEWDIFERK